MDRDVLWTALRWPGLEHLRMRRDTNGMNADGLVVASVAEQPVRLAYRLQIDPAWRTRKVSIEILGSARSLDLTADDDGTWRRGSDRVLPRLHGATDVDISMTPFTNTLPIRRLRLRPGQSRDLSVVYISVPDLRVRMVDQRYTCLGRDAEGARYRYQSSAFCAELTVDADGLVTEYSGLWRRVKSDA